MIKGGRKVPSKIEARVMFPLNEREIGAIGGGAGRRQGVMARDPK